jgi:hypothetical protein
VALPTEPTTPMVCRRLRSKGTPGATYEDTASWQSGFTSTASFWSTATGDAVGPDDSYVHPHVCVAVRACFKSKDGPH